MSKRMILEAALRRNDEQLRTLNKQKTEILREIRLHSKKTTRQAESLIGKAYMKLAESGAELTPTAIWNAVTTMEKATDRDAVELLKGSLRIEYSQSDAEPDATQGEGDPSSNIPGFDRGASGTMVHGDSDPGAKRAEDRVPKGGVPHGFARRFPARPG